MTISLRSAGTPTAASAAVGAVNPAVPSGGQVSDIALLYVEIKGSTAGVAPTVNTPSGWFLVGAVTNNGTLVAATDSGSNTVAIFGKWSPTSSGAIGNLTITGANSAGAVIHIYASSLATGAWDVSATTTASDTTSGSNISATAAANLTVAAGDWLVGCAGVSGDAGTVSSQTVTVAGATMGTVAARTNLGVTTGADSRLVVVDRPVTAGATGAPSYTHSNTSATTAHVRFVRLREMPLTGAETATAKDYGDRFAPDSDSPLIYSITATGDDGHADNSSTFNNSGTVYAGLSNGNVPDRSFHRFTNVAVPHGHIVERAVFHFPVTSITGSDSTIRVGLNDVDDVSAAPTTAAQVNALVVTTATTDKVVSAFPAQPFALPVDVTAAVQEVIDRAGWVSGNDMQVICDNARAPNGAYHWMINAGYSNVDYLPVQLEIVAYAPPVDTDTLKVSLQAPAGVPEAGTCTLTVRAQTGAGPGTKTLSVELHDSGGLITAFGGEIDDTWADLFSTFASVDVTDWSSLEVWVTGNATPGVETRVSWIALQAPVDGEVTSTPVSGTDTAAGTDAVANLSVTASKTDSAAATERASKDLPGADTAAATERANQDRPGADTASASEAASVVATVAGADAATGTDASPIQARQSPDQATGTDDGTLDQGTTPKAGADTATGTDAVTALVAAVPGTDTATGTESGVVDVGSVLKSGTDTATAAELAALDRPGVDSAAAGESVAVVATIARADSAAAEDEAEHRNAQAHESATATERAGGERPGTDSATATERAALDRPGADTATGSERAAALDRPGVDAATGTDAAGDATRASGDTATAADSGDAAESGSLKSGADTAAATEQATVAAVVAAADSVAVLEGRLTPGEAQANVVGDGGWVVAPPAWAPDGGTVSLVDGHVQVTGIGKIGIAINRPLFVGDSLHGQTELRVTVRNDGTVVRDVSARGNGSGGAFFQPGETRVLRVVSNSGFGYTAPLLMVYDNNYASNSIVSTLTVLGVTWVTVEAAVPGMDSAAASEQPLVEIPQSGADSAAASETAQLLTTVVRADTATGTETGAVTAAITRAEVAAGTDAGTMIESGADKQGTDTAAGTETGTVAATLTAGDTAAATDAPALAATITRAETGAATDATTGIGLAGADTATATDAAPTQTRTGADTATASEDVSLQGGAIRAGTDSATSTETGSVEATLTRTEAGAGTDAASLTASLTGADTGTGTDAATGQSRASADTVTVGEAAGLAATLTRTEAATGTDAGSVAASLTGTETGSGTDAGSVFELLAARAGADTATGTETATVVVTVTGADTAAGTDRVTDADRAGRDTAVAAEARALAADLARTDVGAVTDSVIARLIEAVEEVFADTTTLIGLFGSDTAAWSETGSPPGITGADTATGTDAGAIDPLDKAADTHTSVTPPDGIALSANGATARTWATAPDPVGAETVGVGVHVYAQPRR